MTSRTGTFSNGEVDGSDRTIVEAGPSDIDIEKADVKKLKRDDTASYVLEKGHAEIREVEDEKRLVLTKLDESEDPTCFSTARKWLIVLVICSAALCTTCTSSIVCLSRHSFSLALTRAIGINSGGRRTKDIPCLTGGRHPRHLLVRRGHGYRSSLSRAPLRVLRSRTHLLGVLRHLLCILLSRRLRS